MAISVASYLRVLSSFPDKIIEDSTVYFCKKKSAFPPSAGELFAECETRQIASRKAQEWERLGRPVVRNRMLPAANKSDFTLAELADWECIVNRPGKLPYVMRVDKNGQALKVPFGYNGAGQEACYGYLTTKEAALGHAVSASREFTAPRVQTMVDEFNNGVPDEQVGPRWRKPKNDIEAEEMRQEALEALERAPELAKEPLAVSDTLMRQLRGELPIGEGKLGARAVMTPEAIDSFARETIR
jgi:hypothetical protein